MLYTKIILQYLMHDWCKFDNKNFCKIWICTYYCFVHYKCQFRFISYFLNIYTNINIFFSYLINKATISQKIVSFIMSLIILTKNNHFFIYILVQLDFYLAIEMKIYQLYLLCKKIYILISNFFIILYENIWISFSNILKICQN